MPTTMDGYPDGSVLLAGGYYEACVQTADGLVCNGQRQNLWGSSPISALEDASAIAVRIGQLCAINADDQVECFSGDTGSTYTSSDFSNLSNVSQLDAWLYSHCAIADGELACWGGTASVPSLDQPQHATSGYHFQCAIDSAGAHCWDDGGSLEATPQLTNPTLIDAGEDLICAADDGRIKCWTRNNSNLVLNQALNNIRDIEVSFQRMCALDDDGFSVGLETAHWPWFRL